MKQKCFTASHVLFKLCGLTFTDFFAALAAKEAEFMRVMPHTSVEQEPQEVFLAKL
jgi:hypothetical protein